MSLPSTDRRRSRVALAAIPSVALTFWYATNSPPESAGGGVSLSTPVDWVTYKGYTFAESGGYRPDRQRGGRRQDADAGRCCRERRDRGPGPAARAAAPGPVATVDLAPASRPARRPRADRHRARVAGVLPGHRQPGRARIGPGVLVARRGSPRGRSMAGPPRPHGRGRLRRTAADRSAERDPVTEVGPRDAAPQDPRPTFDESSGSRTDLLFGHRLDQMETRYDAARLAWDEDAEPSIPLIFDEGLLLPSSARIEPRRRQFVQAPDRAFPTTARELLGDDANRCRQSRTRAARSPGCRGLPGGSYAAASAIAATPASTSKHVQRCRRPHDRAVAVRGRTPAVVAPLDRASAQRG